MAAGQAGTVTTRVIPIDVLCHFASFLETIAFLQHNIIALRTLEITAALLISVYSILHTWNATDCHFLWAIVHAGVNSWHVGKYMHRRLTSVITDEEEVLRNGIFRIYSRAEFAELKRRYQWESPSPGAVLLVSGEDVKRLTLLTSGCADIFTGPKGEKLIKTLDADQDGPQWIGEMAFFTGDAASATVRVASGPQARCVTWDMAEVRGLSNSLGHSLEASTFRQLPSLFAVQLVARTKAASQRLAQFKSLSGTKMFGASRGIAAWLLARKRKETMGRTSSMPGGQASPSSERLDYADSMADAIASRPSSVLHIETEAASPPVPLEADGAHTAQEIYSSAAPEAEVNMPMVAEASSPPSFGAITPCDDAEASSAPKFEAMTLRMDEIEDAMMAIDLPAERSLRFGGGAVPFSATMPTTPRNMSPRGSPRSGSECASPRSEAPFSPRAGTC